MQYQEQVTEARTLVKRSEDDQWRLAELTHEVVEGGTTRAKWAADIEVHAATTGRWYQMWKRWGELALAQRPKFSEAFTAVQLGPDVEADRSVWTEKQDREHLSAIRNLPPEQKAAVVREALDDPDVAVRTMRDSHTRRNVSDARQRVADEIETDARDREQASPTQREIARTTEHFAVGNHLRLARFHAAEATRQLQEIDVRDDGMVAGFARDVEEIREALDWFDTAVSGGQVDDDALAKFIEGGMA